MGRGLLDEQTLALITGHVPDLTPLYGKVLPLEPDYLSANFPRDSTIPIAGVCFIEALHTLADARSALFECYANAVYYRIAAPAPYVAVWFEQLYSRAVAHDLYAAGNQLAAGIADVLEIGRQDLRPYRKRRRSEQAILASYLVRQRPDHPVTRSVQRLGHSLAYQHAMNHRGALVHGQPPLLEGRGIVYRRGSRWRNNTNGGSYLTFGGGDAPTETTERVIDFLHAAMVELVRTFSDCVDFYLTVLASHNIALTERGLRISLRL